MLVSCFVDKYFSVGTNLFFFSFAIEQKDVSISIYFVSEWTFFFILICNRPFPSSPQPPFQSEAKCEVFVMKISFHSY